MPSINSTEIVKEMLKENGTYPGDPQAFAISEYTNDWGGRTFHIAMHLQELSSLYDSPHCRDIKTLWMRSTGITPDGKALLEEA